MAKYKSLFYSIGVFLLTFTVYALTAAPDVTFTDSGELAATCSTLGIAHQTGYPLFVILGYLWTLLPLPISKIYSLNLMSSFYTAMSAVVFMHLCLTVLRFVSTHKYMKAVIQDSRKRKHVTYSMRRIKPLIADKFVWQLSFIMALTYAFALTVWQQANYIEVYSLHLLLMNLVVLVFLRATLAEEESKKLLYLTAFLLGLSFTNHGTTILLVPAILFFYFKRPGELYIFSDERWKTLLALLVPFFIGLSIYLYMPLRASMGPEFNWGDVSRSFDKLFYHVSGGQYRVWMFTGEKLGSNLGRFFGLIPAQLAWVGIIPVLMGLYRLFTASRSLFSFLMLLIVTCIAYAINYSIHDIDSYFLTGYMAILLIAAVGVYELLENLNNKDRVRFIVPAHILLPILLIAMNIKDTNRSDDYLVSEYTRIMSDNLEKNAIIISAQWDYFCSAFWYKQQIEGFRPDVVLIEKELLRRTWFPGQLMKWYPEVIGKSKAELDAYMKDLELFESGEPYNTQSISIKFLTFLHSIVEKNIDERPVYITSDLNSSADENFYTEYKQAPQGLAIRLMREEKYLAPDFKKLNFDKFISSIKNRDDHLEEGIKVETARFLAYISSYCYINFNVEEAKKLVEIAIRIDPKSQAANEARALINKNN